MAYVALYRKYRPKLFEEVVGQEHITTTLKNQVKSNKIAHAYLFNGPRGTGKTSAAKILSRAVNCLNNKNGNPCNQCEVCKGILDGSIMDVIEIDAASNNSVDNVRDIRDEIIYSPSKTKYKVYIIDEVHMLSTGAFNALLKTLEEPPAHVIFILATTEPHKLLPTIISRCQRFDFKKIASKDIYGRLKEVSLDLDAKIEDRALELIAYLSEGGMRDALSILDQSLSIGKDNIIYKDVLSMVGMIDNEVLFDLSEALNNKDVSKSIGIINDVAFDGRDINNFITRLLLHYRNILMIKVLDNPQNIIDLLTEDIDKLKEVSQNYSTQEIMGIIDIFSKTLTESKRSNYPKILLETAVIKICNDSEEEVKTKEKKAIQQENKPKIAQEKETPKEEQKPKEIAPEKPKDTLSGIAKEVSDCWEKILDDMRAKGFMPLKIQCLNNVTIKPLGENSVLCCLQYKEDIHAKMVEDKKFIMDLTDSIFKVIGKEVNVRFDSKKQVEKQISKIDKFKEIVQEKGMENLINEI